MKKLLALFFIATMIISCTKIADNNNENFIACSGVFILNEGNFNSSNGTLSYFSYDSSKIFNDMFYNINGRTLGDVPNSMTVSGDNAYIVVNNSEKIEVVNSSTLESLATIRGLVSPRNIAIINESKAYVTSIYSDQLSVLDLTQNTVSNYINIHRSSESIIISGNEAFVANWMGGNEVMVINTLNDKVVDSIKVGFEPESMVLDKNKMLWVLCNGGWQRNNFAELVGINTITHRVEKDFIFTTKTESPTCLQIDGSGETLYYLENGVRKMSISASSLPSSVFISDTNHFFYKIGINPANGDLFATDAVDYQQLGYVLIYDKDGTLKSTLTAGIAPAFIYFKLD